MNEKNWGISPAEESKLNQREVENNGKPENERESRRKIEQTEIDQESESKKLEGFDEKLDIAREKLEDADLSGEKISVDEIFHDMEKEENNIKIGSVVESVSNFSECQKTRDKIAKNKVPEIMKALEGLEGIKKNFKTLLSIGAGWGENIRDLTRELGAEQVFGIDQSTIPSEAVKNEMGKKLVWIKGDAMEKLNIFNNIEVDLSELTAFLQILNRKNKIDLLKKVSEISKSIVVVDEIRRSGLGGVKDWIKNKAFNAGMGKYNIADREEWEAIFAEAGLAVKVFNEFRDNDFVAVLERIEDEVKE